MSEEKELFGGHKLEKGDERTKEIAAMGGKAAGKVKKRKRMFKEMFESALEKNVQNKKLKSKVLDLNPELIGEEGEINHMAVLYAAVFRNAASGDLEAIKFIRDTIGETPTNKHSVQATYKEAPDFDKMKAINKVINGLVDGTTTEV